MDIFKSGCNRARSSLLLSTVLALAISARADTIGAPVTDSVHPGTEACSYFVRSLQEIPHTRLDQKDGRYRSFWDQKEHAGCKIVFATNDKLLEDKRPLLVDKLHPDEGNELYRLGWRWESGYDADGPGDTMSAMMLRDTLCLVRESQPAEVDDRGNVQAVDTLTVTIECGQKMDRNQ